MSSKNRTKWLSLVIRVSIVSFTGGLKRLPDSRGRTPLVALLLLTLGLLLMGLSPTHVSPASASSPICDATCCSEEPSVSLTYHSRSNTSEIPVSSGDILAGDHIVLTSTWHPSTIINRTRIEVSAEALDASLYAESSSPAVSVDTRYLNNNASCTVTMTAWLKNGTVVVALSPDVYIGNFFKPTVRVVSPNGGEVWTGHNNITWIAEDLNQDETLVFAVYLSADSGRTYQLLASGLTTNHYTWNCTGLPRLDTYSVQVRVSDGIYMSTDSSDALFTAGDIPVTSTTSGGQPVIDITAVYLLAAIVTSSTMALIVYVAAKRWL
ncbi:MAG: hypothetical protein HXY34_10330 [Candidatus Thorarchaeota archaeon]|nr:hypothetical protein [Candidatus Thorarchaeota archaeon]